MGSEEKITVKIPDNVQAEYLPLMKQRASYNVKIPEIRKIKNAFVSHYGLVLHHGLLAKGCAFNLSGNEDNTFYYPFWKQTLEEYIVCKWGKGLRSVHMKEPCLIIHSKWFNYAFWVNAYLPRLLMAEEAGLLDKVKLLVPEKWQQIPFVWETLNIFSIQPEIIPDGAHIFADTLYLPETRKWTASFYPPLIQKTRERLVKEALKKIPDGAVYPQKVYLTRAQRGVRCVENETEVMNMLKEFGFESVTFENLTVWEQIYMMHHASVFISLHGAGFSNLMFMKPGSVCYELINGPYAKKEYTFPFWKLAHAAGVEYHCQFCEIKDNTVKKTMKKGKAEGRETDYLVNQNVIVNTVKLSDSVSQILKNIS
jgi:hypothetical protein